VKGVFLLGLLARPMPSSAQDTDSVDPRPASSGGHPFFSLAVGASNNLGIGGAGGLVVPIAYSPMEVGQGGFGMHAAGGIGLLGTKVDLGVEWGAYAMLDGKPWTRSGYVGVGVMGARLGASWLRQWAALSGDLETPRNMMGAELAVSLLGTVQLGYYRSRDRAENLVSIGLGFGL
jgi:hypothetical protein